MCSDVPGRVIDRLLDIRESATNLRDIAADMATEAFHDLPHTAPMARRAVKNALMKLDETAKAIPEDLRQRHETVE